MKQFNDIMTKGQHRYSPTEEVNSDCQENIIFSCESSFKIMIILKGISIKKTLQFPREDKNFTLLRQQTESSAEKVSFQITLKSRVKQALW